MMDAPAILEDSSEKKRPRGRPRGYARQEAERIGATITEGGPRARVNAAYRQEWVRIFRHAPEEVQLQLHGATFAQIRAGIKAIPPGWETIGESIGRALHAGTVTDEEALRLVLDARARDFSYGEIAAHFRKLRQCTRGGNSVSLCRALAATLDRYQLQFPATTTTQRIGAVESLLELVRQEQTEEPEQ